MRCGAQAVTPQRRGLRPNDGRRAPGEGATGRERSRVERLIARLTRHRGIVARGEKRAVHRAATCVVAAVLMWGVNRCAHRP